MIPIQDRSMFKYESKHGFKYGKTKRQKYGAYLEALIEHPDIVPYLLDNIDQNPTGEILVKALDMGPALGPYFEKLGETAIGWGLKFALFTHGIFLSTTKSKDTNPKTGTGYLLLRLRRARPEDELSQELKKHLESAKIMVQDQKKEEVVQEQKREEQCGIDPWKINL